MEIKITKEMAAKEDLYKMISKAEIGTELSVSDKYGVIKYVRKTDGYYKICCGLYNTCKEEHLVFIEVEESIKNFYGIKED